MFNTAAWDWYADLDRHGARSWPAVQARVPQLTDPVDRLGWLLGWRAERLADHGADLSLLREEMWRWVRRVEGLSATDQGAWTNAIDCATGLMDERDYLSACEVAWGELLKDRRPHVRDRIRLPDPWRELLPD